MALQNIRVEAWYDPPTTPGGAQAVGYVEYVLDTVASKLVAFDVYNATQGRHQSVTKIINGTTFTLMVPALNVVPTSVGQNGLSSAAIASVTTLNIPALQQPSYPLSSESGSAIDVLGSIANGIYTPPLPFTNMVAPTLSINSVASVG